MQHYHKTLLSLLWLFWQSTSSVPLDVQSKANLHSNPFIILPQSAGSELENNNFQDGDNVERGVIITTPTSLSN